MLKVIRSPRELPWEALDRIYGGSVDRSYLQYDFFCRPRAVVCLWLEAEEAVSALRLDPWKDGLLLAGLETAPAYRRRGYAQALLLAVCSYLTEQGSAVLYSHIDHRNIPSIRVHEKSGFRKISDTARLLDGTVTAQMGTYRWDESSSDK